MITFQFMLPHHVPHCGSLHYTYETMHFLLYAAFFCQAKNAAIFTGCIINKFSFSEFNICFFTNTLIKDPGKSKNLYFRCPVFHKYSGALIYCCAGCENIVN